MQKILIAVITILALCGCSRHYHPLAVNKKARLVSELISEAPQCSVFLDRLASPAMDDDGVDAVYHDATAMHCIKKDI
jgi:hypothetical protein